MKRATSLFGLIGQVIKVRWKALSGGAKKALFVGLAIFGTAALLGGSCLLGSCPLGSCHASSGCDSSGCDLRSEAQSSDAQSSEPCPCAHESAGEEGSDSEEAAPAAAADEDVPPCHRQ